MSGRLDEVRDGLGEFCAEALREYGCPSVSVAVAERGEVVLAEAYGYADTATGRPATPATAYGLASVTKPITATAVCLAADEGLLDLDQPVPVHVPVSGPVPVPVHVPLPVPAPVSALGPASSAPRRALFADHGRWPEPTVRQLLQHRGGFGAFYAWDYGDGARTVDADGYTALFREPGSGFEYANLGYRALGRLLEAVTGQELGAFVRERVFEPLGLTGCQVARTYPGPAPSAVRYTVDGRAYPDYGCDHPGATLGWAPAGELALFAQSYERLLKPETAAAMRAGLPVNARVGYGLGWCVSYGEGPVVLSHGGGGGGVASMAVAVPGRQLSLAVLTNCTAKGARDAIVRYVLDTLVPECGTERLSPLVPDPERPLTLPPGGVWAGGIGTPEGTIPIELRVLTEDQVEVRLGGGTNTGTGTRTGTDTGTAADPATARSESVRTVAVAVAVAVASEAWDLRAVLPLQLPTADARINSPGLLLGLRREGERLTGVAHAYKNGDAEGLLGNFLSHPCELTTATEAATTTATTTATATGPVTAVPTAAAQPASTSSARSTSAAEL
ncbi:serine hydrolase domain-containing protein [Streptomyces sp. NPDC002018]|uniref:serine hydrolase domain-containing protein n=1 Tax=Streptomyces sp. NPDC002018 TaxID=3364629 RepID=UPI0036C2CD38